MKKIKIDAKALEIYNTAIEGNPQGVKGLNQVRESIKLFNALDKAKGKEFLYLETTEYRFLKSCIDTCPWRPNKEALEKVANVADALDSAEEYEPNAEKETKKTEAEKKA